MPIHPAPGNLPPLHLVQIYKLRVEHTYAGTKTFVRDSSFDHALSACVRVCVCVCLRACVRVRVCVFCFVYLSILVINLFYKKEWDPMAIPEGFVLILLRKPSIADHHQPVICISLAGQLLPNIGYWLSSSGGPMVCQY